MVRWPTWRKAALKGGMFDPGRSDNSNTQFAILALWVAGRHQVAIDRTIALVEKRFRTTQDRAPTRPYLNGGSWPYNPDSGDDQQPLADHDLRRPARPGHRARPDQDAEAKSQRPLEDPAIRKGLAMLGREIDRPGE